MRKFLLVLFLPLYMAALVALAPLVPLVQGASVAQAQSTAVPQAQGAVVAQIQDTPVIPRWELAKLPQGGLLAVLWLEPAPGFHTYAHQPGDAGMPTTAEVKATPSGVPLTVLYPPGREAPDAYAPGSVARTYDGPTPLFIPLPAAMGAKAQNAFGLEARVSLLACSATSCWPLAIETSFSSREVASPAKAEERPWWPVFVAVAKAIPEGAAPGTPTATAAAEARRVEKASWAFAPRVLAQHLEVDSLLKAIPLAILAGVILNLMPCVLPVVCLKLAGLLALCRSRTDVERNALLRTHNMFFALGILIYFTLLAVILGLAGLAWGQLFQQPGLILGAAALLFALGLSLFGVFHLPVVDLKVAEGVGHSPRTQAVMTGFLATLLATPCSGPFLGGVLAWTMLQPVYVVVAVFLSIGLGMAGPFLALAIRPQLVRFVPRPGAWMAQLEKMAGFLLMATSLYFLSILPQWLLLPALAALLLTALACHAWGSWSTLSQSFLTRWTVRSLALGLALAACIWAARPPAQGPSPWQPFDADVFSASLGQSPLLVDFTADWCPTCKALEKTILTPATLARLQAEYGFTAIRVDLTREDPKAMALLRALGSASIPVAALFPAGETAKQPVVLRDLFTSGQLEEGMRQAFR